MISVKNILQQKSKGCFFVTPQTNIVEALKIMAEKHIGILLVQNENGNPIGVFSERDFVRKIIIYRESALTRTVEDFMTTTLYGISAEKSIQEAMQIMSDKHIRHLLVCDNKNVAGIISMTDIINALLSDQDTTIKSLNDYIYGTTFW